MLYAVGLWRQSVVSRLVIRGWRDDYTVKTHSISAYNDILRALDAIGKIISVLADFTDNVILVLRVNLFTPV
ncbi:hypothetical protein F6Q07_14935 [Pectobacterium parmentieri]|uniref:Uncharacterized protein n=1 Tax=Pectobacterium parmentieri TaxID=1905730 RepID=A0A8B3FAL7_PECPM|nr:hypothetical protein C5E26_16550 [Pectobacterium parmentieri]AYH06688.1 hypothetical protein C5E25_15675 [Pectobacterium parmentieri]AYH11242.1 hypothetical protein C5E24_16885 [Pectobacterium parmentieri]AYH15503.1 hypothetical protein C5E23_15635 [Pectobacterium parmentieri]AYH18042.1 hypothetical protein C5E22_05900 [Pectobacterium parmentieri]